MDEESEQDPGEIFDPNQYKNDNINEAVMTGDLVNGNIETKQDEEVGKGTVKGSSIADSGAVLLEQPNLVPNLNQIPI